ncbi:permease [bacterium]|nr:permease [bacterium]MCB2179259.1 permease [bacterium]
MTTAVVVLWLIMAALGYAAWRKQDGSFNKGIALGWQTAKRNALILVLAFITVGFVEVLSPQNLIETYLGPQSGWRGLLLAEVIGMLLPGGPYAVFPIIGVIYAGGAGLGPVVTLVASYSLLAFLSVSFELPFMGWRFSVIRWGTGLLLPLLAGLIAMLVS